MKPLSSHRRSGNGTSSRAGFTLIEMLVAAALLSLLAIAVLGALRFSGTIWQGSERHAMRVRDRGIVEGTLRELLTALYPAPLAGAAAAPRISFEGSEHALEGSVILPAAAASGGHRRFRLETRMLEGEPALVLAWRPERGQPVSGTSTLPAADETAAVLLPRIDGLTFAYYGRRQGDPAAAWHPTWRGGAELPGLIRLDIQQLGASGWPPLIAQPALTADALCVFDRLSRTCPRRSR